MSQGPGAVPLPAGPICLLFLLCSYPGIQPGMGGNKTKPAAESDSGDDGGPGPGARGGASEVAPAPAGGAVVNQINGGIYLNAVVQGRTVHLHLPPVVTPATGGLPPATPAFAGRGDQLREILTRLAPDPRDVPGPTGGSITVLAGLGGVGKSELALQVGCRALAKPGWFPGGVLFLDMFGYDEERRLTPEAALDALLRRLAVPLEHLPTDRQGRSALYRTILKGYAEQGRRVLVILDNASSSEQVRSLLPSDGATPVLLTSRHTLTFHLGERLYDLDILEPHLGVEVIRNVLRQADPADARVATEPAQALRISELCAGLPLALRVATALLAEAPARPLADLARMLEDTRRRLDRLSRRADLAVRAAFELSYRALAPEHARLFRFLSLGQGPDMSTVAAARLLDEDPDDVQDLLGDLARAHLVGHGATYGRWRLHDLVRLFAHEQGRARAEEDRPMEALGRLFEHYRLTTEAADAHLGPDGDAPGRFPDLVAALEWLDAERPNLVATVQTAHVVGRPDISVHLAFALTRYLDRRRHIDDWIGTSTTAVGLCHQHDADEGMAAALNNHGLALAAARRFDEAVKAHSLALGIKRERGDPHGMAESLSNMAGNWCETRRFEDAVRAYTAAARIFGELDDDDGRARALVNLVAVLVELRSFDEALAVLAEVTRVKGDPGDHDDAVLLMNRGKSLSGVREFDRAVEDFSRAAHIYRRNADQHGEASALTNLGNTLLQEWRIDEALDAHTRAAELLSAVGDRHGEAVARNSMGLCLMRAHRLQEAIEAHTRGVEAFRDTHDRHGEGLARTNLGMSLAADGRAGEAVIEHTLAAELLQETSDPHGAGIALNNLGCALRRTGEFGRAIEAHDAAAELFRQTGDRKSEADVHNNVGTARREMGQLEEAVAAHAEAAAIYREISERHGEAEAAEKTAAALLMMNRFEEADRAGAKAAEIFQGTGDRYGEAVALANRALALVELRRFDEAVAVSGKAVLLFRALDSPGEENAALRILIHAGNELDGGQDPSASLSQ